MIVVSSKDHKIKHTIMVKPQSNPYYEEEHERDNNSVKSANLFTNAEKIKIVKNIYYE